MTPILDPMSLVFGAVCCGVLWLSARIKPARYVAALLLLSWCASKVLALTVGWTMTRWLCPVIDLLVLTQIMCLWWYYPAEWLFAVACAILVKLTVHMIYFSQLQNRVNYTAYEYVLTLNVLFGIELAFTAYPGGRDAGRRIGGWLSRTRLVRHGDVSARAPRSPSKTREP